MKYNPDKSVEGRTPDLQLDVDAKLFGDRIQRVRLDSNRVRDPISEFAFGVVKQFSLPSRLDSLLLDTAVQYGLFSILADLLTVPVFALNLVAGITIAAILALMLSALWYDSRIVPMVLYRVVVIILATVITIAGNIVFRF